MLQRLLARTVFAAALVSFLCGALQAQIPAEAPAAAPAAGVKAAPTLNERQLQLAQRYRQLEAVLLRMAELSDDPQRVALLRKAVAQSKEQLIGQQLNDIADLLEKERLANAITEQAAVKQDLGKLLELLLSEDRSRNVDEEKHRLQQWIRDISNLIKDQQGLQGETDGGTDPKDVAERQAKVGEKTGKVADEISAEEAKKQAEANPASENAKPAAEKPSGEAKPAEDKPATEESQPPSTPSESKPSENQPADGKPSESKPSEGEPTPGSPSEAQPSESQPSQSPPSPSPPSEGQPSESSPPQQQEQQQEQQPQNPTEQRLKQAQQRMEEAKKKLDEAKKQEAIAEQAEAIRELRAAKAELEKILQQLREEEMQRTLAMLEQRFRKMLASQIEVYEATQRLDSVAAEDRTRNDEIEAGRQSRNERAISVEAGRALELLKQDGTAVAFPEAVGQMIEDMDQAADWLGEAKVGELTQALEQDIIASLESMIAALEKAQKDLEDQKDQPKGPSDSPPSEQEQELVNKLAELKMIRSLQFWVNRRTELYGKKLQGNATPAEQTDMESELRKLAERQERIYRTTRDISQEKNQ